MVANKYAFLQITRRRFLNEWEAFKRGISRRNIRRRIRIQLTLSNLKLLRGTPKTETSLHRTFPRRQVPIQNRAASNRDKRKATLNFLDESPERQTSFIEISRGGKLPYKTGSPAISVRSEERFSRNAETDLVCRLLLEKKNNTRAEAPTPALQAEERRVRRGLRATDARQA